MSSATISAITDKGIPELKQWQQRSLSTIKSAKILGLYLSENQGANVWLSVLTDLQNCGMDDILIACVDGLTRFPEAINSIYPDTEVQLCVIHQIRNSIKYGSSKHHKAFMADLKPVYRAVSKEAAETALDELEAKWGQQYPVVLQSWRRKWDNPSHYFRYPAAIRKVIYTTNAIEWGHRQFRKLTETKGVFLNENSLLKLLYPGLNERARKMDNADPELEFDIVPVGDLF